MRPRICLCFGLIVAGSILITIIYQSTVYEASIHFLYARQPTSETLARQPTSETLTRQPTTENVARQPNTETLASLPTFKTLARQPTTETLARQPNTETLTRQPTSETLASLPTSKTLARHPPFKTLRLTIDPLRVDPEFLAVLREPLFEEATHIVATPPYVVPNIVHFIWFASDNNHTLSFINYVSILSAHRIQKPELLLLHCNHLPSGKWWRKLWLRVPLKIVHREPPRSIFNQTMRDLYHAADVAKFQLMQTYGGIYLDMDVIVVNSLEPLRVYKATLGKEKPPKLIAGIMVGAPGAEFFRLVYESYRGDYRSEDWDYNCARRPYELYVRHPHLLHVETYKLTTPDFLDRHMLFDMIMDWHDLYVIHIMGHVVSHSSYELENIRTMNTTLGEVMRYIYYGSPTLLPP